MTNPQLQPQPGSQQAQGQGVPQPPVQPSAQPTRSTFQPGQPTAQPPVAEVEIDESAVVPAAPIVVDDDQVTYFGATNFRNENRRFGIKAADRRRHVYTIGKTGMGKSTLLENMIIQDIRNGNGLAVVDPHGDLVEKVINYIPSDRINDVIYFNPSDLEHPIAFNILESVNPEHKNLVSNGLVGVFKKIWADSWGPRLEYILINTILALIEYPGSTLLGVTRMLVDGKYRKKVVRNITDPVVKSFWVDEFNNYSEKFRNEAIAPIQNKVGQFLSSSLIRNIVGQSKSTLDMRQVMDSGKILLMNLSKGRIGEENASLLGAMMITKIQLAAMSRVDIPEQQRRDFYLYVDEFQNFATESFAGILSEARKYRLDLIMAHQYIEQLSDEVKAAVFGNIGTLISFRVGAIDAEELAKEFAPQFLEEDIVTLPAYNVYLRLMIDGVASEPFSALTLPPLKGETGNAETVLKVSRERYSGNRVKIEEAISRWAGHRSGDDNDDDDKGKSEKGGNDRKGGRADDKNKKGRNDKNKKDEKGGREGRDRNKREQNSKDKNKESAIYQDDKVVEKTVEKKIPVPAQNVVVPAPPYSGQGGQVSGQQMPAQQFDIRGRGHSGRVTQPGSGFSLQPQHIQEQEIERQQQRDEQVLAEQQRLQVKLREQIKHEERLAAQEQAEQGRPEQVVQQRASQARQQPVPLPTPQPVAQPARKRITKAAARVVDRQPVSVPTPKMTNQPQRQQQQPKQQPTRLQQAKPVVETKNKLSGPKLSGIYKTEAKPVELTAGGDELTDLRSKRLSFVDELADVESQTTDKKPVKQQRPQQRASTQSRPSNVVPEAAKNDETSKQQTSRNKPRYEFSSLSEALGSAGPDHDVDKRVGKQSASRSAQTSRTGQSGESGLAGSSGQGQQTGQPRKQKRKRRRRKRKSGTNPSGAGQTSTGQGSPERTDRPTVPPQRPVPQQQPVQPATKTGNNSSSGGGQTLKPGEPIHFD